METRGAIYFHKDFKFDDGEKADKLFILLNTPTNDEPYLFVKTTSKQKYKPVTPGCIESKGAYFIPANTCFFNKPTWVLLHDVFPVDPKTIKGSPKISLVGDLKAPLIDAILECLDKTQGYDLPEVQKKLIWPNKLENLDKLLQLFGRKR